MSVHLQFSLPHFKGLPLLLYFYLEHPWWPKLEKDAMAASIGCSGGMVQQF